MRPWPTLCPTRSPLLPVAQLLPTVWGMALESSQREALSRVRWPQDLQLRGLAMALSQPHRHPSRSGGLSREMAHGCPREPEEQYLKVRAGRVGAAGLEICWELLWNGPSSRTAAHVSNRPWNTHRLTGSSQQPADAGAQVHPKARAQRLREAQRLPKATQLRRMELNLDPGTVCPSTGLTETTEMGKRSVGGTGKPAIPPVRSRLSPPGPGFPQACRLKAKVGGKYQLLELSRHSRLPGKMVSSPPRGV